MTKSFMSRSFIRSLQPKTYSVRMQKTYGDGPQEKKVDVVAQIATLACYHADQENPGYKSMTARAKASKNARGA